MSEFPRTMVGGVSLPRLLIGSNWFLGYSHTSQAKDRFITMYQNPKNVADILMVFLEYGIDAVMGPVSDKLEEAVQEAEQRSGKGIIRIITPHFNIVPGGPAEMEAERVFDVCKEKYHATFCMPHQAITDALADRMHKTIRDLDKYTKLIRERDMIPGLSTHMPETVVYADRIGADVETYIQLYNAAGFLLQVEADWVQRIIQEAKKPVMTIKPLAAGRLLPIVGFAFVWNTIRDQDMVTIGTTTPDEARESIEISLDLLNRRRLQTELQKTRSKSSLD
ncbi:MAG: hypothetical protein JXA33_21505 [Anaerolineae bacterium]|nr:hypothetical protein [Anaerolineae bacterium]